MTIKSLSIYRLSLHLCFPCNFLLKNLAPLFSRLSYSLNFADILHDLLPPSFNVNWLLEIKSSLDSSLFSPSFLLLLQNLLLLLHYFITDCRIFYSSFIYQIEHLCKDNLSLINYLITQ